MATISSNKIILDAIEKAVVHKAMFFSFCMPMSEVYQFGAQISDCNSSSKFVIHPFIESCEYPELFIANQLSAEELIETTLPIGESTHSITDDSTTREEYMKSAFECIDLLKSGRAKKIVLSRIICEEKEFSGAYVASLFDSICKVYPQAYKFLFYTPQSGYWIGASPEKLLSCHSGVLETMALAGSRKVGLLGEWREKELEEQAIVARYIEDVLSKSGIDFEVSPLYTKRAGVVEHLCNDFKGVVNKNSQIENILSQLHPTPALAGIPKNDSLRYIVDIEKHSRKYYGGYVGYVDAKGDFDLFVNLRSMNFDLKKYSIYVGGGLTDMSDAEAEWNETEIKSMTMQNILKIQ